MAKGESGYLNKIQIERQINCILNIVIICTISNLLQ